MVRGELLPAESSELVVLCALLAFCPFPLGLYPLLPLETMQGGVERTCFNGENLAGPAADDLRDGVAVHGLAYKGLEDEHVQRSLQQFDTVLVLRSRGHVDVDILRSWMESVYIQVPSASQEGGWR